MKRRSNSVKKFNGKAANWLSRVLSSMWLFWFLATVLVVIGIVYPPDNPYTFVMFWVSAVFQAIALPVLAFVSNIQGDRQEKIMRETYENVLKELELINKQLAILKEQGVQITDIADDTNRIEDKLD